MSQNKYFYFTAEESLISMEQKTYSTKAVDQSRALYFLFIALLTGVMSVLASAYFYTAYTMPNRSIASITSPEQSVLRDLPQVQLEPLLVRSVHGKSVRLSKVDIDLYVRSKKVQTEIKESIHKVRDHLVFILSAQEELAFVHPERKIRLAQEITHQLNLFLTTGKVESIRLQQKFLN